MGLRARCRGGVGFFVLEGVGGWGFMGFVVWWGGGEGSGGGWG